MIVRMARLKMQRALIGVANHALSAARMLSTTQAEEAPEQEDVEGSTDPEVLRYLFTDPVLEDRRVVFTVHQIMHLLWDALHRRGAPVSQLVNGKWLWAKRPDGEPLLAFIRPGIDA